MSDTTSAAGAAAEPGRPQWALRRDRRFRPRHLAYAGLLAVVVVCVWLLAQHYSDDGATVDDAAIDQLFPVAESKILQQEQIGIDLAAGYEAQLSVNGIPLPDDEVQTVAALNQVLYQPGPGRTFEQWPAGRNCVVASFWRSATPQQATSRSWCFTVV